MIKGIIEALIQLILTVKKNLFSAFISLVLIITVLMSYSNSRLLDHFSSSPTPQQEQRHFQNALYVNDEIDKSLKHIIESTGASRATIRQFHNGKHDLTGLPFTSVTTTYLVSQTGIKVPQNAFDDFPISYMNKTLKSMWARADEHICVRYDVDSIPDDTFKAQFVTVSAKQIYICPMVNLLNYPIGYIELSFDTKETVLTPEDITYKLEAYATRTAGYLTYIIENNKPDEEHGINNLFGLFQ